MDGLKQSILSYFLSREKDTAKAEELASALKADNKVVASALRELCEAGELMCNKKKRYGLPAAFGFGRGIFRAVTSGAYGFVSPDKGGDDVFIPAKATAGAWNGDTVLWQAIEGNDGRAAGSVMGVLTRANASVTGVLVLTGPVLRFIPDERKLPQNIALSKSMAGGAAAGERVALEIMDYGGGPAMPRGRVVKRFGPAHSRDAACAAILYKNGITPEFEPEALAQAEGIPQTISEDALSGRLDLRGGIVFTIDGDDAKDLDDAVSISKKDGNYLLGVHIADVSNYVTASSPLDGAAFSRGTSVYYADRVVPMLPERLSNGICSLNPGEDRLTLTAMMEIDPSGKTVGYELRESVIRTAERMTYKNCNALLEGKDAELLRRYAAILPDLRLMAELADILREARKAEGSLELETVESKIICAPDGAPLDVVPAIRGRSEKMIEEFMLSANKTVAEHFARRQKPAVYRVHSQPEPERLREFARSAGLLGYSLRFEKNGGVTPAALQALLSEAKGRPDERVLSDLMLRAMPKAFYSPICSGHFGIAARYYCHFTSPIRRYPDLVVHRFLKLLLSDSLTGAAEDGARTFAARAAETSSERELAADSAERDAEKLYKAEYMQGHIGEVYDGVVASAHGFGLFVELENTVEGLVRAESLGSAWVFDEDNGMFFERGTRRRLRAGMPLRVVCTASDPATGEIDFEPAAGRVDNMEEKK